MGVGRERGALSPHAPNPNDHGTGHDHTLLTLPTFPCSNRGRPPRRQGRRWRSGSGPPPPPPRAAHARRPQLHPTHHPRPSMSMKHEARLADEVQGEDERQDAQQQNSPIRWLVVAAHEKDDVQEGQGDDKDEGGRGPGTGAGGGRGAGAEAPRSAVVGGGVGRRQRSSGPGRRFSRRPPLPPPHRIRQQRPHGLGVRRAANLARERAAPLLDPGLQAFDVRGSHGAGAGARVDQRRGRGRLEADAALERGRVQGAGVGRRRRAAPLFGSVAGVGGRGGRRLARRRGARRRHRGGPGRRPPQGARCRRPRRPGVGRERGGGEGVCAARHPALYALSSHASPGRRPPPGPRAAHHPPCPQIPCAP